MHIDKSSNDSVVSTHAVGVPDVDDQIGGADESDDTSNEAVTTTRFRELTEPKTGSLPENDRKVLKRNLKFMLHLLQLDASKEIPPVLQQEIAKHKLKCSTSDKIYKNVLRIHMENVEAITMQLNATHGDEEMSHVMHMASMMDSDIDKSKLS